MSSGLLARPKLPKRDGMSVSPDQFRRALRQWPSGVSVVTSFSSEPVGLTVSSFFSVSLVPPLVGVCLDRKSATLPIILATRLFGVSVLSAGQADLSERFAGADESVRFQGVPLFATPAALSPLYNPPPAGFAAPITSAQFKNAVMFPTMISNTPYQIPTFPMARCKRMRFVAAK